MLVQSVRIGVNLDILGVIYMGLLTLVHVLEQRSRIMDIIIGQEILLSANQKVHLSIKNSSAIYQNFFPP